MKNTMNAFSAIVTSPSQGIYDWNSMSKKAEEKSLALSNRTRRKLPPFPKAQEFARLVEPLKGYDPEKFTCFVGCPYQIPSHHMDGKNVPPSKAREWDDNTWRGVTINYDHNYKKRLGNVESYFYDETNQALWVGGRLFRETDFQKEIANQVLSGKIDGLSIGLLNQGRPGNSYDNEPIEISITPDPHYRQCVIVSSHSGNNGVQVVATESIPELDNDNESDSMDTETTSSIFNDGDSIGNDPMVISKETDLINREKVPVEQRKEEEKVKKNQTPVQMDTNSAPPTQGNTETEGGNNVNGNPQVAGGNVNNGNQNNKAPKVSNNVNPNESQSRKRPNENSNNIGNNNSNNNNNNTASDPIPTTPKFTPSSVLDALMNNVGNATAPNTPQNALASNSGNGNENGANNNGNNNNVNGNANRDRSEIDTRKFLKTGKEIKGDGKNFKFGEKFDVAETPNANLLKDENWENMTMREKELVLAQAVSDVSKNGASPEIQMLIKFVKTDIEQKKESEQEKRLKLINDAYPILRKGGAVTDEDSFANWVNQEFLNSNDDHSYEMLNASINVTQKALSELSETKNANLELQRQNDEIMKRLEALEKDKKRHSSYGAQMGGGGGSRNYNGNNDYNNYNGNNSRQSFQAPVSAHNRQLNGNKSTRPLFRPPPPHQNVSNHNTNNNIQNQNQNQNQNQQRQQQQQHHPNKFQTSTPEYGQTNNYKSNHNNNGYGDDEHYGQYTQDQEMEDSGMMRHRNMRRKVMDGLFQLSHFVRSDNPLSTHNAKGGQQGVEGHDAEEEGCQEEGCQEDEYHFTDSTDAEAFMAQGLADMGFPIPSDESGEEIKNVFRERYEVMADQGNKYNQKFVSNLTLDVIAAVNKKDNNVESRVSTHNAAGGGRRSNKLDTYMDDQMQGFYDYFASAWKTHLQNAPRGPGSFVNRCYSTELEKLKLMSGQQDPFSAIWVK